MFNTDYLAIKDVRLLYLNPYCMDDSYRSLCIRRYIQVISLDYFRRDITDITEKFRTSYK